MKLKDRFKNDLETKKRLLFSSVLSAIEQETKRYEINKKFFEENDGTGFKKIRSLLLDLGNEIVRFSNFFADFINESEEMRVEKRVWDDKGNSENKL